MFVIILVKKYQVLNCTLICIKGLAQSKKKCIPAAYNMKLYNTLLFGLMLSAQVKKNQPCWGGFLAIPSTSSNEDEMSCSMTHNRAGNPLYDIKSETRGPDGPEALT